MLAPKSRPKLAAKPLRQAPRAQLASLRDSEHSPSERSGTQQLQAKLRVSQPHDRFEQEADRVADHVMRMPARQVQQQTEPEKEDKVDAVQAKPVTTPFVQKHAKPIMTPLVQRQEKPFDKALMMQSATRLQRQGDPDDEPLQMKPQIQRQSDGSLDATPEVTHRSAGARENSAKGPVNFLSIVNNAAYQGSISSTGHDLQQFGPGGEVSPQLASQVESHVGRGQSLSGNVKSEIGRSIGIDLPNVKIHSDSPAADMNEAFGSQAFTYGNDIFFNRGYYNPNSAQGKRLLAHELTHTVQQGKGKKHIQRALKFEIQTVNFIWQKSARGNFSHVKRKFGEFGDTERGELPAYITTGKHGSKALKKGDEEFVEVQGERRMKKAKAVRDGIDTALPAQFVKEYRFKNTVIEKDIIGKPVGPQAGAAGELEFINQTNNADILVGSATYNPNTFEFIFYNSDGTTQLDVHLDEDGNFQKKHWNHMKVGRSNPANIDKKKEAQYVEVWKVTDNANGDYSYFDPLTSTEKMVDLEKQTSFDIDHSNRTKYPDTEYNPGTYEKKYYKDNQFTGSTLNAGAVQLNVHLDDGRLKPGHVKYMEHSVAKGNYARVGKRRVDVGEEQTAMELQSEDHGFIEFETPKWFNNWADLKLRVDDAFAMTQKLNTGAVVTPTATEKAQMEKIKDDDSRIDSTALGTLRKWPSDMIAPGVAKRLRSSELYVEIVDPAWHAFFQTSEGLALSDVDSILQDSQVDAGSISTETSDVANQIFNTAKSVSKYSATNDSVFDDLKGFIQLIVSYIMWGQINEFGGHKDTFPLMARTNFGNIYTRLLRKEEKELFNEMVGKASNPADNPFFIPDFEKAINAHNSSPITLDRSLRFFAGGHRGGTARNPFIYQWLQAIPRNKDLLAGSQSKVANAIGGKEVNNVPGGKDYHHALFEKRWGDRMVKAVDWTAYAKEKFDQAMQRSGDTANDPTTPKIDESSKTSLKLK